MRQHAVYTDVTAEVTAELRDRVGNLTARGVREEQIILDPGLGFAKRPAHDWALLRDLDQLLELGFPLLPSSATTLRPASVPLRSTAVMPPVSDLSTCSTMRAASR